MHNAKDRYKAVGRTDGRYRRNLVARAGADEGLLCTHCLRSVQNSRLPILILPPPAVRIFAGLMMIRKGRAAPSERSCPCEGVGDDDSYEARDGTGFGTTLLR